MKMLFYLFVAVILYVLFDTVVELLKKGELFNEGAIRKSLQESGRTVWLGMKIFIVLWFFYLLLNLWLRSQR